jgi:hypothetical protein
MRSTSIMSKSAIGVQWKEKEDTRDWTAGVAARARRELEANLRAIRELRASSKHVMGLRFGFVSVSGIVCPTRAANETAVVRRPLTTDSRRGGATAGASTPMVGVASVRVLDKGMELNGEDRSPDGYSRDSRSECKERTAKGRRQRDTWTAYGEGGDGRSTGRGSPGWVRV